MLGLILCWITLKKFLMPQSILSRCFTDMDFMKASWRGRFLLATSRNCVMLFFVLSIFSNCGSIESRSVAQCWSAKLRIDITRSATFVQLCVGHVHIATSISTFRWKTRQMSTTCTGIWATLWSPPPSFRLFAIIDHFQNLPVELCCMSHWWGWLEDAINVLHVQLDQARQGRSTDGFEVSVSHDSTGLIQ